jgi:hypothetical protein
VGRERPDLQLEELRRRQQPYRASIASTERRCQGDLEHVRTLRRFLAAPEAYLRHL